jgi:hypothetical protein
MKGENLFDLMQNSAISALALHSFVLGYNRVSKGKNQRIQYPRIEYLFFVLPIVYNQSALEAFKSSEQLFTAISKNNSIILGLQDRANKMSCQTFDGINLAFSKKILTYNNLDKTIEPLHGYKAQKIQYQKESVGSDNSVRKIQITAYKLGAIFAKRNQKNIQIELNINF